MSVAVWYGCGGGEVMVFIFTLLCCLYAALLSPCVVKVAGITSAAAVINSVEDPRVLISSRQ